MIFNNPSPVDTALQGINSFTNPAVAHSHVKQLCQSYPSLKPEQRRFPRNGGYALGIILTGTVPMIYQGRKYNIPVNIVLDNYPQRPIVIVTPTATMQVSNNHPFVASNGRCDKLQYLQGWQPGNSTLLNLAAILSREFGNRPPVHAKPASGAQPVNTQPAGNYSQPLVEPMTNPQSPTTPGYGAPIPTPSSNIGAAKSTAISKVKKELGSIHNDADQELAKLKRDQQTLQASTIDISSSIEKMVGEKEDLVKNISVLKQKLNDMNQGIASLQQTSSNTKPLSESVVPADAWSKQILEGRVLISSTEELLFALSSSVSDGHITIEECLKGLRDLFKKQFYAKELERKIVSQRKIIV
ncbi:hypothetical protein GEMRC1_009000 [Eukaryota sp. GEM-RC1]